MEYSEIKELIKIFEETDLNDMEVWLDNAKIRLNRSPMQSVGIQQSISANPMVSAPAMAEDASKSVEVKKEAVVPAEAVAQNSVAVPEGEVITAPLVGTFYQSSAPDEDPFVKVGDYISSGDVVCIIEAMKFMNEVNSDISGEITEVLVKDGEFVEFGQPLFRVK